MFIKVDFYVWFTKCWYAKTRLSSSLPPFVVVVITVTGIHKITK